MPLAGQIGRQAGSRDERHRHGGSDSEAAGAASPLTDLL